MCIIFDNGLTIVDMWSVSPPPEQDQHFGGEQNYELYDPPSSSGCPFRSQEVSASEANLFLSDSSKFELLERRLDESSYEIKVKRKLDTGDDYDRLLEHGGTYEMLFARATLEGQVDRENFKGHK